MMLEVNRMHAFALCEEQNLIKIIVSVGVCNLKISMNIKDLNLKLNGFFSLGIEFINAVNGDSFHFYWTDLISNLSDSVRQIGNLSYFK